MPSSFWLKGCRNMFLLTFTSEDSDFYKAGTKGIEPLTTGSEPAVLPITPNPYFNPIEFDRFNYIVENINAVWANRTLAPIRECCFQDSLASQLQYTAYLVRAILPCSRKSKIRTRISIAWSLLRFVQVFRIYIKLPFWTTSFGLEPKHSICDY